ncbi:MAG: ferritin [Bacteroidales bacterium]|nr:ferritin [Bacteroidales bacterium]MCL2133411.1 ferritin [Bacteroidales bacterium]
MLEQKMETALNQQVNAELWSAYLYLSMSYDMDDKGYEGMASWFALQAKEEFEHATRFMKFIGEREGKVKLTPIAEVQQVWDAPKNAFDDTLKHEKIVTEKIHKLMDMAIELKDYATQNMLKWFIDEQVEEEDTVRKILETLKRIESSPAGLYALDKKLGKRGGAS